MRVNSLKASHQIRKTHASARNWLERNCGDVPHQPVRFNDSVSRMTRQAHAAHSCMLHYYQNQVRNQKLVIHDLVIDERDNQMLTIQLPFTSKEFSPKGSKRAELVI